MRRRERKNENRPAEGGGRVPDGPLYLLVDPESREAFRFGEGPTDSGPIFFTSREVLDEFARRRGIVTYQVHEVPAGILARMKGKPHWVDWEPE